MKIYLVDNANDGHHKVYQDTLNKINNTQILNKIIKFTDLKENFITLCLYFNFCVILLPIGSTS